MPASKQISLKLPHLLPSHNGQNCNNYQDPSYHCLYQIIYRYLPRCISIQLRICDPLTPRTCNKKDALLRHTPL